MVGGHVKTHFWATVSAYKSGYVGHLSTQAPEESSAYKEILNLQSDLQIRSIKSAHNPGGHWSTHVFEGICA